MGSAPVTLRRGVLDAGLGAAEAAHHVPVGVRPPLSSLNAHSDAKERNDMPQTRPVQTHDGLDSWFFAAFAS